MITSPPILGIVISFPKQRSDFHPLLGDTAELNITIDNLGFAPAYRRFTTELILTNRESGDSVTVPVDFDNRPAFRRMQFRPEYFHRCAQSRKRRLQPCPFHDGRNTGASGHLC